MQIKLDLHVDTVNALLTGLSKLPYEVAVQHINIIQQQASSEVEAAQQVAKAKAIEAAQRATRVEDTQLSLFPELTAA